jgi:hypothetical protein
MTKQVKLRNNKLVLYLLCFVKIFPKLNIGIKDLNMIVSFSWFSELVFSRKFLKNI